MGRRETRDWSTAGRSGRRWRCSRPRAMSEAAAALDRQRWWFLRWSPRDDEGVVWHLAGREEVWVDSIYMVVPLARAHRRRRARRHAVPHASRAPVGRVDRPLQAPRQHGDGGAGARQPSGVGERLGRGGHGAGAAHRRGGSAGRDARPLAGATRALCSTRSQRTRRPTGAFTTCSTIPTTFTDGTAGLMFAYAALTGVADGWLPATYAERRPTLDRRGAGARGRRWRGPGRRAAPRTLTARARRPRLRPSPSWRSPPMPRSSERRVMPRWHAVTHPESIRTAATARCGCLLGR